MAAQGVTPPAAAVPLEAQSRWPLSLSQHEVWLDQRAWPGSAHLNIGGCAYLRGPLDLDLCRQALVHVVQACDALRLVPLPDGTQLLLPDTLPLHPAIPRLEVVALRDGETAPDQEHDLALEALMADWWQQRMRTPFALGDAPPWRVALLQGHDRLHGVFIQFHHLVMDGWGTVQVIQRWSEVYNALLAGQAWAPDAQVPAYLTYIDESLAYRRSEAFERDAAYWRDQVPVLPPLLLERRYPHANPNTLPPAHLAVYHVPRADYDVLVERVRGEGLTPFNHCLAALVLYFARVHALDEVVVGIPSLNRGGRRYRQTPGMFVGVLALRVGVNRGMTVQALLQATAVALRGALRHPRYPLSELGRHLGAMRAGRDGLLDVLLSFEQQDYTVAFGEARPDAVRQLFSGLARYALGVTVCEFREGQDLEWVLEGSSTCFEPGEVDMLGRRLWHLVQYVAQNPNTLLADVPLMPDTEREAVLHGVHQGVVTDHTDAQLDTFVQQFVDQAHQRPHAVALLWDGGQMVYAELHQRALHLARELALAGAGPDKVVALALERGPELVIALLGTALAGAAFLPLDVDAPLARLGTVLDDSEAVALLVQGAQLQRLGGLHPQPVVVRHDRALPPETAPSLLPDPPPCVAGLQDLAYVLFTSGSTGRPKGVAVTHGILARRLVWLSKTYQIGVGDCAGQGTQATFDPALIELLLPLVQGARLALPPPGRLLPEQLGAFAVRHGVTFMAFVPSTLSRFLDGVRGKVGLKLRVACCGGETLPPDLAQRYLRETGARLFNVYGPTEAAIFATAWACERGDLRARLPIGKPLDDTRIYVLGEGLEPMPFGVAGEIYIGGEALARGYLHRPDLTAAAFVPDPFNPGGRMYRTGDRGWWGRGGELHFGGRLDRQVKLRGYRLELGEIEATALQVPGVAQAAARLVQREGQPALCLWVAPQREGDAAELVSSIKRVLRARLPDYMVPAAVVGLPTLPESSSGKIAYDQLPSPHWPVGHLSRGPATDMERTLLALWEGALTARPIGVADHFFDLGGDSLAAMNLLAELEKRLGTRVHLHTLLENPTIEALAVALDGPTATPGLLLQLDSGVAATADDVPVYMAASGHGDVLRFQALARALGSGYRVYMLQPPLDNTREAVISTPDLALRYAELLATRYEPGYLLGFSVGGVTALETARQLEAQGFPALGLVLLDTIYPHRVLGGVWLWRALGWLVRVLHLQDLSVNGRRLGALFSDAGLVGQVMALEAHTPQPVRGRTLLLKTSGLARWDRWFFRPWRCLFQEHGLQEDVVQGLHGTLFEAPNLPTVADRLRRWFVPRNGEGRA